MHAFESFPGDDPVALDAAARALLSLPLEWTAGQLAAEPACVHDHWGGTHTTVAFVRPDFGARYVRCEYASDHGVYPLPELVSDACRRSAVRAFVDRFAHAPQRYPKPAYAPMIEARMAPTRPGMPPAVLARGTVGVGDDPAAVLVFTAPECVFGRHARAVFGPLVVAIADIDPIGSPPTRECLFSGCADDADEYAFAELVTRMRAMAVERAAGADVQLHIELHEHGARSVAPRPQPLVRAAARISGFANGRRLLSASAVVLPIDSARETYDALLCGRPEVRSELHPASVVLETSIVTAIEPV